ncbi:Uncharacterised protein [uncultured archaeon]|nr:Uncharacterised protein [uncultured archaeon]
MTYTFMYEQSNETTNKVFNIIKNGSIKSRTYKFHLHYINIATISNYMGD